MGFTSTIVASSFCFGTTIGALVETDLEVEGAGRLNWTVACGSTFVGAPEPPTFAVSFLASGGMGAGPTGAGVAVRGEGDKPPGGTEAGFVGAIGGTVADGITGAIGGFGIPGLDGGFGMPTPDGGLGIPGTDGGLGMPAEGGGMVGDETVKGTDGSGGGAETGTGFGGRLIIAFSRGDEGTGAPSLRAGRTMRTVSFFGSAIFLDS